MMISALESLLLTKNDRDYLGKKLAEKTSFLLEKNYDKRIELYKLMEKYYGKRSNLMHSGTTKIDDVDERNIEYILTNLIYKLTELTTKYDKMEQKSSNRDKEGVEDFINKLKFS